MDPPSRARECDLPDRTDTQVLDPCRHQQKRKRNRTISYLKKRHCCCFCTSNCDSVRCGRQAIAGSLPPFRLRRRGLPDVQFSSLRTWTRLFRRSIDQSLDPSLAPFVPRSPLQPIDGFRYAGLGASSSLSLSLVHFCGPAARSGAGVCGCGCGISAWFRVRRRGGGTAA